MKPATRIPLRRLPWFCGCAAVLLAATWTVPARAADDHTIGFVLELSGDWVLVGNPSKPIAGGDQLPSGGVVRPAKSDGGAYLVVCLYDGQAKRFDAEATLPARMKEAVAHRVWSAVAGRYRGGVVQAASRGGELLSDGVVGLTDGKLDLAPLMADLPAGSWTFRLRLQRTAAERKALEAAANNEPAPGEAPFSLRWEPDGAALVELAGLKPGLYELQIVNPRTKRAVGSPAVVLVCDAPTYEKARTAFAEARALTETWSDDARDSAAGPFLRAYLEQLAAGS